MSNFDELFITAFSELDLANRQEGKYPKDEVLEYIKHLAMDDQKTKRERHLMRLLSGSTVFIERMENNERRSAVTELAINKMEGEPNE
jgi:hypothetical protein